MKIFYAVSTHWDREWYKPFQGFRYELVKMTDKLIDALENDKIDAFTFDGQTIVIEDYLEIKPQNKKRIAKLIKEGKLKVGPWYVMPDELLVSGESLIRNFLVGKSIAESYGSSAWKFGYMNDIFGHIAQMPQILDGFGIKNAYLGRGMGRNDQNYTNFIWKAPDGSECYAYKENYANLKRKYVESKENEDAVEDYLKNMVDKTGAVIMLYTDDHNDIDENTLNFQKYKDTLAEKYEMVEGLENITDAIKEFKDVLPCETGELITTGEVPDNFRAVTHSISSYYPLKRENDICENILENKISPMLALAKLKGMEFEIGFYNTAYKYLLKNHPHDSICGCSSDVVHQNMYYRYSQVHSIADAISDDFGKQIEVEYDKKEKFTIEVFNFDLKKYEGVFVTEIQFDKEWTCKIKDNARYQTINAFSIFDEHGNELQYQILDIKKDYIISRKPYIGKKDKYTIAIMGNLNAFGTTIFKIVPGKKQSFVKDLSDGELEAENEYILLSVSNDGSVTIKDKKNGKIYSGLNTFVDDGEIGNGWFSESPLGRNNIVSSKGAYSTIEVLKRGTLLTQFRVTKYMSVPKAADYDTYTRSEDRANLKIITDITLKAGSKYVEFETMVENNACDHRLRMEFPTGLDGENYFASQAFTFIERGRGVTEKGAGFAEPEPYEKNTSGIVLVTDNNSTLSFIGKEGIHEIGVSKSGVISVTMLRGFGRIMWDNIENQDAQLLGTHKFRYAISVENDFISLLETKKRLMEVYQNVAVNNDAASTSMFELKGNAAVSIVKPAENGKGIIIRLYNPSSVSEKISLQFSFKPDSAAKVNLAEDEFTNLTVCDNRLVMEIPPNKIETIYVENNSLETKI